MDADGWIALYAAVLSTLIAVVGAIQFLVRHFRTRRERSKFQVGMYLLRKQDRSGSTFPIVTVLAANLGDARVAIKSIDYDGVTTSGKTQGSCGWYEQPEELFGIRNRLLPRVLSTGETADFPSIEIGVFEISALRVWLTDFDERRYYLDEADINKVRSDIAVFLAEQAPAARHGAGTQSALGGTASGAS